MVLAVTCISNQKAAVKPVLSGKSNKDQKMVFKTDYRLMQVKVLQNAPREHSAILSTYIKLSFVIRPLFCHC